LREGHERVHVDDDAGAALGRDGAFMLPLDVADSDTGISPTAW